MLDDVYRVLDSAEQTTRAGRERIAAVAQFRERIGELVGRGETVEGKVAVEATTTSPLNSLHIDPRAMRLSSEELAAAIQDAFTAANDNLREQSRRLMDEVGLTAQTSQAHMDEMRATVEQAQRDLNESVRGAAQRLDDIARRRREDSTG
jgi:DNA-binding protein YbaB